jgi:hypothetical protein
VFIASFVWYVKQMVFGGGCGDSAGAEASTGRSGILQGLRPRRAGASPAPTVFW